MDHINENIYQIYFFNSQQIETIQDLEFDESYNYKEIGIIVVKKSFFSFL